VLDVSKLDPKPPGFGKCRRCSYRDVDRAAGGEAWAVCYACASKELEPLSDEHCDVCGQEIEDSSCPNYVCGWGLANRGFSRVQPIAKRTGVLRAAISAYKYDGQTGWALIFGRVVVGYLDAHDQDFDSFDWIIPVPTFVGAGGRAFDHTWKILEVADLESYGRWPFSNEVMVKTGPTKPFTGCKWKERREIAEGELRQALMVPDPSEVAGKRILVFDDVFTDGFTMREVARLLRYHGATEVAGIVLARQPY
jgi:predicted amidophosphoribosyltransferase